MEEKRRTYWGKDGLPDTTVRDPLPRGLPNTTVRNTPPSGHPDTTVRSPPPRGHPTTTVRNPPPFGPPTLPANNPWPSTRPSQPFLPEPYVPPPITSTRPPRSQTNSSPALSAQSPPMSSSSSSDRKSQASTPRVRTTTRSPVTKDIPLGLKKTTPPQGTPNSNVSSQTATSRKTPVSYVAPPHQITPGQSMIAYTMRAAREGMNGQFFTVYPPICGLYPPNFNHPLHSSVMSGDLEGIKSAIAAGGNPNQYCGPMRTSELHWAVMMGNDKVVECLVVDCGADIHYKPGLTGSDTSIAALCYGRHSTLELVLKLGAKPNFPLPIPWWTRFILHRYHLACALHIAAAIGAPAMISVLLNHGANPLQKNANGAAPIAFCNDNPTGRECKALLQRAAAALWARRQPPPQQPTAATQPEEPVE